MSQRIVALSSNDLWSCCQTPNVLSRSTAIKKLDHLIPGSQEHTQLQDALLKKSAITEITLPNGSYKIDSSLGEDQLLGGFGSSEHVAIGEAIQLQGLPKQAALLKVGVNSVHFQHIVALAGDFYGVAGQPISWLGGTDLEKIERFKAAFATLAQANPNQLRKILIEIDQECQAVKYSSLPHHCYSDQMMQRHHALQQIKSDINALLADNSDHFSTNAEDAYRIGHAYAMQEAREAGHKKDLEGLKRAYALDAFACHFLTDLFASGHIRNQRGDLETFLVSQLKFTGGWVKKLAGILTGAQHEKDGHEGLNVSNRKGQHWRAYGDGHFFSAKNEENKNKVIEATQYSVDEIYAAYFEPDVVKPSAMEDWIPHATSFNPLPLYEIKGTSLFLHIDSGPLEIKTQTAYLNNGLSQALSYLPQKYIDGAVDGVIKHFNVKTHPLINKVITPQIERLTGMMWQTLGMASVCQLRQNHAQLNGKIDEMAQTIQVTYKKTASIFEQLQEYYVKLVKVRWDQTIQELKEAVREIKDSSYENHHFQGALSKKQLETSADRLWKALIRIGSLLEKGGTLNGEPLLSAYGKMLQETSQMGSDEIKISQTVWLKELLDYQSCAFCMYGLLQPEEQQEELKIKASKFQTTLWKQIEANQTWVDTMLLTQKPQYIALQIEKIKMANLWRLPN